MTWALPAIAAIILAYAAVSGRLAGTPLTAPIIFTAGGLILGLSATDAIDLHAVGHTVKLLAEATLGLVLFADAARVNITALRSEISIPARLLGVGLPLTILAGFGAAALVLGDLAWPEMLLLAVILAPTDAALGQAVVTRADLPSQVRQGLNVESGLNDGICVPLFLIVLAIAHAEAGAIGNGAALRLVLEQIGYGALVGIGAGAIAAAILIVAGGRGAIEPMWRQVIPATAAALAYTLAVRVEGSGFIAAFVGGLVFGAIVRQHSADQPSEFLDGLGDLLSAATFIVFGAALLVPALAELSWRIVVYAVLSLTVVRMVPVALSLLGGRPRLATVAFLGWFGPRGLATIVFAILILEEPHALPSQNLLLTTAVVTVALSIAAHGVTAAPLAARYAAWYNAHLPRPGTPRERA
ncbi:MAG TPA: cation:proton antiporter [Aldersonia sp.]